MDLEIIRWMFKEFSQGDAARTVAEVFQPDEFGTRDIDRGVPPMPKDRLRDTEILWRFRASYPTLAEALEGLAKAWLERVMGRALRGVEPPLPAARAIAAEQDRLGLGEDLRRNLTAERSTGQVA